MHLLVYVSDFAAAAPDYAVIRDIVQVSKHENPKRNITGALFFFDGKFLQVLEGREEDLRGLMRNIERDPRHAHVEYLIDSPIRSKGFQTWNMDSFNLDSGDTFDRGTIKAMTQSFKEFLLPRSDALVVYYKALLRQSRD